MNRKRNSRSQPRSLPKKNLPTTRIRSLVRLKDLIANAQNWFQTGTQNKTDNDDTGSDASTLELIVGLGNPGPKYEHTRHNVGERWARNLADKFSIVLRQETRFQGFLGRGSILGHDVRILIPTTFMNRSGNSVGSVVRYFKIPTARVLVAYDEVAFPVGTSKLKLGGGHNGHNGIGSLFEGFAGDREFARLRIGVGHPGDGAEMHNYLTGANMPSEEREIAESSSELSDDILQCMLMGNWQRAMWLLHTPQ